VSVYEIIHGFLKNMGGIGRALLFIAGGCLIGAVLVGGEGRMAFVTTGIALSIAGLVFYLIGRQLGGLAGLTKHMRASGLPGTATVVGVSDTGVTVNNDPVAALTLDVAVGDGIPYRVETRQLVSRMAVGSLQPGTRLPVLVDPNDKNQVFVDFSGGAVTSAGSAPAVAGIPGAKVGSAAELLAKGRRGTAVITAMQDMGDISDLGLQEPLPRRRPGLPSSSRSAPGGTPMRHDRPSRPERLVGKAVCALQMSPWVGATIRGRYRRMPCRDDSIGRLLGRLGSRHPAPRFRLRR
jgi:hypothetical protein